MILRHPCIRYAHVAPVKCKDRKNRALVVYTDLAMPEAGHICTDERLPDLLEYLAVVKHQHEGEFDEIDIRGVTEDYAHLQAPQFLPAGRQGMHSVHY